MFVDKFVVTTSWDGGHPLDLKLAKLLTKYDIPRTFYIPIDNIERKNMDSKQIKDISKEFEIGGHTYHHKRKNYLKKKHTKKSINSAIQEENITKTIPK
ncbi:polysaccharide deacetylase family protein [Methanonatronarchaeum sp. AMET-Sl]|uniref:polysaccharide deacetylase family protein n=1 Tax=Methanonatronarchaeum sp. AMET-Sl TaxID=3037654 RepID=UPI00244E3AA5|nr:polysaccharide deacetylase family protein [Methanonatronarchaeum sp. AMET-Sl]WGI17643.1 polysaccharide deacetylase family protein [Methanonatronarchaeum sp. AMET-Sl]